MLFRSTRQVVMAGGAWASSFLHQRGIRFPQSAVRSSILSVGPGAAAEVPPALHTKGASVTRRADGAFTMAISGSGTLDLTPGALKEARHFAPMALKRWRVLRPGGLQAWRAGFETRRHWALDKETPMERVRILDPVPSKALIAKTLSSARALMPALRELPVQATWAGYIDSTPDGVPVIDSDIGLPGVTLAAGLSGHGFGIGPGVGHLVADLVLGRAPLTSVAQYRLARFEKSQWGKIAEF